MEIERQRGENRYKDCVCDAGRRAIRFVWEDVMDRARWRCRVKTKGRHKAAPTKTIRQSPMELNAEGGAAAAGAFYVGIVEFEAGALDGFDVVDGNAVEVHLAHLVDEDFEAFEFVDVVACLIDLTFESHVVAETGAAATYDRHAQTRWRGVLLRDDLLDFRYGNRRKSNH